MRTIEFEELAWRWREALEAAQTACRASGPPVSTTNRHVAQLVSERTRVVEALRALALVYHLDVAVDHLALSVTDVRRLLGLPFDATTCVFNLDGVLVPSANVHAAAWKETFDEFVLARSERTGGRFVSFDLMNDYHAHIHGQPRLDGVRALLASRGIRLPEGTPNDAAGSETVHGLANRKRDLLLRRLRADRLNALAGSRHYLEVAREAGIHRVVVSASANALQMLDDAGLLPLVEACVDGRAMEVEHLQAKPAPDALLAACSRIGADPRHAVAFETTQAGIAAAHRAGFQLVVSVEGAAPPDSRRHGADRVVASLAELLEQQVAA